MILTALVTHLASSLFFLLDDPWLRGLCLGLATAWLVVEAAFYLYVRFVLHPRLSLLRPPAYNYRGARGVLEMIRRQVDMMAEHYSHEKFVSVWFRNSPLEDIRMGNLKEHFSWACTGVPLDQLSPEDSRMVDEVLVELLEKVDMKFEPGYNPKVKPCRLNLEPVDYIHRPFAYYLGTYLFQQLGNAVLLLWGFERLEEGGLAYWYRPVESDRLPLLFFHGISPGLVTYLKLALSLASGRTALLFESPHISMCLGSFDPPTRVQTLDAVEVICKRHHIERFVVVGHSFGSIPAGWLATSKPWRCAQVVFLDGVSMLLTLPDVCYNFLYKRPSKMMEGLIYYFASRELTINHALHRTFWWYENICNLEELSCPSVVALSGADAVVPSEAVRKYVEIVDGMKALAHKGEARKDLMETIWWEGMPHGYCLFSDHAIAQVQAAMKSQEDRLGICRKAPLVKHASSRLAPSRPRLSSQSSTSSCSSDSANDEEDGHTTDTTSPSTSSTSSSSSSSLLATSRPPRPMDFRHRTSVPALVAH